MTRLSEKTYFVFSGLLLIGGSLLAANGGRQHPTISNQMGAQQVKLVYRRGQ